LEVRNQLRLGWRNGVTLAFKDRFVHFDPSRKLGKDCTVFISHAHADHLSKLSSEAESYLTPETFDIASVIQGRPPVKAIPLGFNQTLKLDEFEIIAHNAGHMLGSAQFELRSSGSTVVYTGDINCRNMFTTSAAESIPCDSLILETTYGVPYYTFPDLTITCAEIVEWALQQVKTGKIPVFRAYSGGKAQEIIKIFNVMTRIPVIAEGVVAEITEAYVRNGVNLNYFNSASTEAQELLKTGECVCISSQDRGVAGLANSSLAVATGWALGKRFLRREAAFPLSSHADFDQLIEYVKQARPREVITVHGFKEEFADYLRRKFGIKARPISPLQQDSLTDFF
jgi:Cft2 family RNA processing exonuclease